MKKIIYSIKKWWEKTTEEYHRQLVLKREKEVKREAMHRLQVREFEGGLYLCLDNIPILKEIEVKQAPLNALQEARRHYQDYKLSLGL
jgi:hypothetical protein